MIKLSMNNYHRYHSYYWVLAALSGQLLASDAEQEPVNQRLSMVSDSADTLTRGEEFVDRLTAWDLLHSRA